MGYALKIKQVSFSDVAVDRIQYVDPVPCTGISFDKSSLSFESAGDTNTITATVTPSDTTDAVVWASSDSNVATVENGVVTIHGIGSATITATCGSHSASASIAQTSIKPNGGSKVATGYAASISDNTIALNELSGQSTVGQNYDSDDVNLRIRSNATILAAAQLQLIPVPYGATKAKFKTSDDTAITINFVYIADMNEMVEYSDRQYPKALGSYTSVNSANGQDVVYGQCIAFRLLDERLAKFSYVYFT